MSNQSENMASSRRTSSSGSTMSEFIRRRWNAEVPIFGGNVRNGIEELSSAVTNSVVSQLMSTTAAIGASLRRLDQAVSTLPRTTRESTAYRIRMMDLESPDLDLSPAYELDDARLQLLLDASEVEVKHTRQYFSLLSATRERLRDDVAEQKLSEMTLIADQRFDWLVDDGEIAAVTQANVAAITEYAHVLGLSTESSLVLVKRSLVHNSLFQGRETNRALAMLGTSALSLLLEDSYVGVTPASDISAQLQSKLSRVAIRSVALRCSLDALVVAAADVDVKSTSVLNLTLCALYGAIYKGGGMEAVSRVNREIITII